MKRQGERALLHLIDLIYLSVADSQVWPQLLKGLAEVTHSRLASLVVNPALRAPGLVLAIQEGMDAQDERRYAEHYSRHDPFILAALRGHDPRRTGAVVSSLVDS